MLKQWNQLYDNEVRKVKGKYWISSMHETERVTRPSGDRNKVLLKELGISGLSLKGSMLDTAVMLKRQSNTRFASVEDCPHSFMKSISALRKVVKSNEFDTLYLSKNAWERLI